MDQKAHEPDKMLTGPQKVTLNMSLPQLWYLKPFPVKIGLFIKAIPSAGSYWLHNHLTSFPSISSEIHQPSNMSLKHASDTTEWSKVLEEAKGKNANVGSALELVVQLRHDVLLGCAA